MSVSPESIFNLMISEKLDLLPDWSDLPTDPVARVTQMRKLIGIDYAPAALELSELRRRADEKLHFASQLVMDREAYEQSTSSSVASWRAASLVKAGVKEIADLTCAIGIDACAMASAGIAVDASDISSERVAFAEHNARILVQDGMQPPVFSVRDAYDYPEAECYYLDPSRRSDSGVRGKNLDSLTPSISLVQKLINNGKRVVVKLSAATPDSDIQQLQPAFVEFVSLRGVCREAVLWIGNWNFPSPKAAVVDASLEILQKPQLELQRHSQPADFVHEPDPAVIRAGLLNEVCHLYKCHPVAGCDAPFLTSDEPLTRPVMHSYSVLAQDSFTPRKLNAALKANNIGTVIVKTKGSDFDADTIRKQVKSSGPVEAVVIMTKVDGRNCFFLCKQAFD